MQPGYYAGVGSRETPDAIAEMMFSIAYVLGGSNWTLRSGCARGADTAFEEGCVAAEGCAELFLPWKGFEGRQWEQYYEGVELFETPAAWTFPIARQFHPAWDELKQGAQKLHARNVHQILGPHGQAGRQSSFVVCWTPSGDGGGGTGQAIRVARHYGVSVFDLALDADRERIRRGLFT